MKETPHSPAGIFPLPAVGNRCKHHKWVILIFLLACTFSAKAQTSISGHVVDSSGKPLAHANVLLLNQKDSSLFKGMLANDLGAYTFTNVAPGKYLISSTFTGETTVFTAPFDLSAGKENLDMGTLKLESNTRQLEEVKIVAKKPLYEQKIDRLVINVAAAITYAGLSVLDVLERSPGIMVNRKHFKERFVFTYKSGFTMMNLLILNIGDHPCNL